MDEGLKWDGSGDASAWGMQDDTKATNLPPSIYRKDEFMKQISARIGRDDWLHETWKHKGKTYQTMVPPRLGGTAEDPQKTWDGIASLRMANTMALGSLGSSNGEPYDSRIEDR